MEGKYSIVDVAISHCFLSFIIINIIMFNIYSLNRAGITPTPFRRPRGRPRKRRPGEDPHSHHGLFAASDAGARQYVPLKDEDPSRRDQEEEKKPREEMSYREIYPDLEVLLPLRIITSGSGSRNSGVAISSSSSNGAKSTGLDASVDDLSYSGNPKVWSAAPPPDPKSVPTASFRSIHDSTAAAAAIAASPVEKMFNHEEMSGGDRDDFGASHLAITRPAKQFLKHVPLTSEDLEATVEYDMDDQDYYWLDEVNCQRRKGRQKRLISRKVFEFIMDRFEKEWFQLVRV